MQYLGLALYAEGPADYYFLRPLLQRLCEDLCIREATVPVEVSEVLALDHPDLVAGQVREERIVAAAEMAKGAWRVLFVHADGANDWRRARREQIDPGLDLLYDSMGHGLAGVAVVPIRETEAWCLVDGDAFRRVFGTELDDLDLGLPSPRAAETVTDPKAVLSAAFAATHPSGRRLRQGTSPYLNALGEQISLACLRKSQSFRRLEDELRDELRRLAILR